MMHHSFGNDCMNCMNVAWPALSNRLLIFFWHAAQIIAADELLLLLDMIHDVLLLYDCVAGAFEPTFGMLH